MEDLTGKTLGQYQITGPLGEGGMAAVWSELKLMLIVRFVVGLALAGVFLAAARWAIRNRAIRGATWLAFLATEFVVLGELANQYLVRATGFPM